jgi:uncharacterized membrane protein YjfL (UPF0719 family)
MLFGQQLVLFAQGSEPAAPPPVNWQHFLFQIFATIIYLIIGLAFFCLSDWLVERVLPRSLRKGIEEDKNIALAIVIAAVILGVALIVSAAIRG